MELLRRLWKRRVARDPDRYRAYVNLPVAPSAAVDVGEARDLIDDLERLFEGRLDVRATADALIAVTDDVPAETFDAAAFDAFLDRLEAWYAGSHEVARHHAWRRGDDGLVRSTVVVPVRPLFPSTDEKRSRAVPVSESE